MLALWEMNGFSQSKACPMRNGSHKIIIVVKVVSAVGDLERRHSLKFMEFGAPGTPVVFLLHGGGLSWWSCRDVVSGLQDRYFVVTPILDGHGEDGETEFISIENSAQKLLRRIDERYGGHIFALCGLSLGAQITAEALAQRPGLAEYAVIESALICPLGFSHLTQSAIRLTYGLVQRRWFAKLQAKSLALPDDMFEDYFADSKKISLKSLQNITRSNAAYTVKFTLRNTTAKVLVAAGEKEPTVMKKSAETLHETIPGSQLYLAPGLRHGELSIAHGREYAELLVRFFSGTPFRGIER